MKNVLIISYSYPPSNAPAAQRPFSLAKFLDKSKYNVTVITCRNADSSIGFDLSFNENIEDVSLIKINSLVGSNIGSYRSAGMVSTASKTSIKAKLKKKLFTTFSTMILPDKAIFWYPKVISYLKKNNTYIDKTDILFTTSPLFTNHLIGNYIKKRNSNIKWLADFRDFHYVENWSRKSSLKSMYHKRLEQKVIRRANIITFISAAMQEVYEKYYLKEKHKMHYVYNGFDMDDFKGLSIDTLQNSRLTIFYAGSFYKGVRSPFPLLSILDSCFEKKYLTPNEIVIKIAGNFEQDLLEEAKNYKSFSCIEFLGRIPRSEVLNHLTKSDLLWLIVGNEITHYTGVPIKFYEYLASRRPIINFAPQNSEPTKIIKEFELGVSFDSENTSSEKDHNLFNTLIEKYRSGKMNAPLDAKLIEVFTRDKQAKIFEELFEE
ncbi:glycosyltransferase family protein [Ulvibacter antarcticus]|uniref:Glycosyltransferase involved in cell wall biosynthesis n=1 Tax=Ulvibacter antarcticus TaxID=442714 RepID=A0A3L9YE61_9FLAO|nr:hypothetical protein [Ulvibacter antarcticus]RMA58951.1 glycosyltransferase involved in cell wall biosynthesis [Ulvibacter antarcticus]